jgi:16S rRNA (guanine527-N7)-methyltransferase
VSLQARLAAGATALGLALPAEGCERLLRYLALIQKWNRVYNLTAIRDRERMLTHHLLDSLAVVPHLQGGSVLDVGTGAGLPGIPLALANPSWRVTLLESNHKKCAFLQQALGELRIENASVACARVEQFKPSRRYDVVISRAFSELPEYLRLAGGHCAPGGVIAAMKGIYPFEELRDIPAPYVLGRVVPVTVPLLNDAERHLVLIQCAPC